VERAKEGSAGREEDHPQEPLIQNEINFLQNELRPPIERIPGRPASYNLLQILESGIKRGDQRKSSLLFTEKDNT